MIPKVSIYYFPYTFKSNSKGEAPIYCKITVNGESKRFSTGISIFPKQWDTPKQKVKGKNLITEDINNTLQAITEQIQVIEKKLLEQQPEGFTLDDLYFCYKQGIPDGQTFLAVMKDRLDVMGKLVGTEYSKDTYRKFKDVYNHTISFIKKQYNMSDIPLKKLDYQFIAAYQQYLLKILTIITKLCKKLLKRLITY